MLRFPSVIFISFIFFSFIPFIVSDEIPNACLNTDSLIADLNWNDFNGETWYELYRADNSHTLECTTVKFEKSDKTIHINYKGKKDENNAKEENLKGTLIDNKNSIYKLNNETQSIVEFKKNAYTVIYGCIENAIPANNIHKLWILSNRPTMNFVDLINIQAALKDKKILPGAIQFENLRTTLHAGKICSSSPTVRALATLIAASTALMKLL